jgi:hypothetical protein
MLKEVKSFKAGPKSNKPSIQLKIMQLTINCLYIIFYFKQAGFAAPIQKHSLLLLFFIFFLLDQKERKNQENPNVALRQSLSATRTFIFFRSDILLPVIGKSFWTKTT